MITVLEFMALGMVIVFWVAYRELITMDMRPNIHSPRWWTEETQQALQFEWTTSSGIFSIDVDGLYYYWDLDGDECYGPFRLMAECQIAYNEFERQARIEDCGRL
jgi:hypothetical protein